jgi:hypothetical protein
VPEDCIVLKKKSSIFSAMKIFQTTLALNSGKTATASLDLGCSEVSVKNLKQFSSEGKPPPH